jgi:hypothetical protein
VKGGKPASSTDGEKERNTRKATRHVNPLPQLKHRAEEGEVGRERGAPKESDGDGNAHLR